MMNVLLHAILLLVCITALAHNNTRIESRRGADPFWAVFAENRHAAIYLGVEFHAGPRDFAREHGVDFALGWGWWSVGAVYLVRKIRRGTQGGNA